MFNWRNFPWTDFQDLNLDWILRRIKEIKTEDLPALDDKIDNVYNYIRENLPDIVQHLAGVIIDVTTVGATGDGVTDDSAAINTALTMGSVLYFPAGTYCFKNVTADKPVYMFGDGDSSILQPIRYSDLSNQYETMITFNDSVYLDNMQLKPAAPVSSESGPTYYIKSAIKAERADHVHLSRLTIDRVYQAYHTGWANPVYVPFEEREGMAFTAHSCNEVCLEDCHVIDYAGEELIWICQDRETFANGSVKICNCTFEKTSYGSGSVVGVLGGNILCTDNLINNFNACYDDPVTGAGTILNMLGANTIFNDNCFYNCRGGNYVDFSEGFFTKSEHVKCSGNIFKGTMHSPIRCFSVSIDFSDNYIEAPQILNILATSIPFVYHTAGGNITLTPYCADINTVFTDFDTYSVRNNKVVVNAPLYAISLSSYSSPFFTQFYAGGDWSFKKYVFIGNEVTYNSDAVPYGVIFINQQAEELVVKDNMFNGAGLANPELIYDGHTLRSVISGRVGVGILIAQNNIIDGSMYNSATAGISLVTGSKDFRSGTDYNLTFNTGLGYVLDHSGVTSTLGGFHANYNDNLIANS